METFTSPTLDPFGRGYYLHHRDASPNTVELGWRSAQVGEFVFGLHERTEFVALGPDASGKWVAFVGLPIDLEAEETAALQIARRIFRAYTTSVSGEEVAIRDISYLSGRFVGFLGSGTEVVLVPDCHATLAAFWTTENGFVASSHSFLTATLCDLPPNPDTHTIMSSPLYTDPGGRYHPGLLTPFRDVYPLIANCIVRWNGKDARYSRFYPFSESKTTVSRVAAEREFRQLLTTTLRLMSSIAPLNLSLTAGLDSNTLLRVAPSDVRAVLTAYTYFRFEAPTLGMIEDLLGANSAARRARVPHRVLRLESHRDDDPWMRAYSKTFPRGARFPALAKCYAQNFRSDDVSVIGTIVESGTVFYRERDDPVVSARRLASKFSTSPIGREDSVVAVFEQYIRATEFTNDRIGAYDYHDLFYWEHRNSKWASIWYSEIDLSHRVLLPFNSRALIELMLALPFPERRDKVLLKAAAEGSPP